MLNFLKKLKILVVGVVLSLGLGGLEKEAQANTGFFPFFLETDFSRSLKALGGGVAGLAASYPVAMHYGGVMMAAVVCGGG